MCEPECRQFESAGEPTITERGGKRGIERRKNERGGIAKREEEGERQRESESQRDRQTETDIEGEIGVLGRYEYRSYTHKYHK